MGRSCFALVLGLTMSCGSADGGVVGEVAAPVVYGADDRFEVFAHPDPELRRIAEQSIVALIPSFRVIREADGTYSLFTEFLGQLQDLCPDERFVAQPTAASCSGVLIDDDLVLTAGHCIEQTPCSFFNYVFNYHFADTDRLAVIQDEDVYSCQRVVARGSSTNSFTPDFALMQLDRPVEGAHAPATVRPATALDESEQLTMIGFGSGLPAKIDSGGAVADPRAEQLDYFVANVDAFQGHSGSATFDSQNRLAGILVAGNAPDYRQAVGESCYRVSVYDDAQAGEVVHNVAPIVDALCTSGYDSEDLCGPGACEGVPCGAPLKPAPSGPGVVPGGGDGCSAGPLSSPSPLIGWLGLLLLFAVRRLRRPAA
jgi:V8-like Glu-specific endopeptidase